MAYLRSDQITGEVVLNISVNGNKIINNANNSSTVITSMIGSKSDTVGGISSFPGKFHSHGLLPNIYISNESTRNKILSEFTYSAWMYLYSGELMSIDMNSNISSLVNRAYTSEGYTFITNYNDSDNRQPNTYGGNNKEWKYYSITKKDNIIYFFVNGKKIREFTYTLPFAFNCAACDRYNGGNGCIDDYVLIIDQCLWTEDFTVPTEPLLGDLGYKHIIYPYNMNENNSMKIN